jgi:hypothetical protein
MVALVFLLLLKNKISCKLILKKFHYLPIGCAGKLSINARLLSYSDEKPGNKGKLENVWLIFSLLHWALPGPRYVSNSFGSTELAIDSVKKT